LGFYKHFNRAACGLFCVLVAMKNAPNPPQFVEVGAIILKPSLKELPEPKAQILPKTVIRS
jgi:hypothetical protein